MTNTTEALERDTQVEYLEILGARVHNLQNIDLNIPRDQLVVITGLSGSGKSSLAFDTIYAEGQRRYIETFSSYARQFLGNLERPDVDKINGLSPVISIEQKTTSKSPRSTVGTITEVYDFLRLLFARIGTAYSYNTNLPMVSYNSQEIGDLIRKDYAGKRLILLAPVIRARKGHYRELFERISKQGFVKVRVNGEIQEITPGMRLDRYKTHDIEIVIDRLLPDNIDDQRLQQSLQTALKHGNGVCMGLDADGEQTSFYSTHLMCKDTGLAYPDPEPNSFSFNSPKGACQTCNGLGESMEIDLKKIIPDDRLSIQQGGIKPLGEPRANFVFQQIEGIAQRHNFTLKTPINKISQKGMQAILYGSDEFFEVENKNLGVTKTVRIKYDGVINHITHQLDAPSTSLKRWAKDFMKTVPCPDCKGSRVNEIARNFKIDGLNISEVASMDITELKDWIQKVPEVLTERQRTIGTEIVKEIKDRVGFLNNVGLGYLNLNRSAKTLSGGEAQRIRLATQIGSQLVGVLYILDEPSIGLHQSDNDRLIDSLCDLRDIGNSVIVVEHDRDMMVRADHIIDMGPGAGKHGGKIVAEGSLDEILKTDGLTAKYLSGEEDIFIPSERREGNGDFIELKGASGNNLKSVDVKIPLGTFTCITGVSGSGKSTLINETLYPILNQHFYKSVKKPLPYKSITGLEHLDKVIDIDQSPIGRTPRSNPATYTGVWSDIRSLFAQLPEAKIRGYKPGRFSFNVKGGRCETCEGAGVRVIEMNFLPDVHVPCETCQGKRFNRETLEIRFKGKSISDILALSIEEAVDFFENQPKILRKIATLNEVGLGYINLGQPSTTLSGGEAQRVKLATELSKRDTGRTFYILDEPTTGLHFEDVRVLLDVLQKLVNRGNTVAIIEHNLDVIKVADYIIDMGPEGGRKGGKVVGSGNPENFVDISQSKTAKYLAQELKRSTYDRKG